MDFIIDFLLQCYLRHPLRLHVLPRIKQQCIIDALQGAAVAAAVAVVTMQVVIRAEEEVVAVEAGVEARDVTMLLLLQATS